MSECLKYRVRRPAHIQTTETCRVHLLLIDDRHKKIRRDKNQGAAECWRRYANDRKRMFVQLNGSTDHGTIVLEMTVPVRVAEHQIRRAIRPVLIGSVEETAEMRA